MFSNLATKVALKKVGLPSDTFDFSSWKTESKPSKKITKTQPASGNGNNNSNNKTWSEWMSVKSLPLTVQPWLTPRPPPIPVADPPRVGDLAPLDRDRKLAFGGGKKVLVVFLRCVGCAFAQKTYLHLRTIASKHPEITCIAVSHSSQAATNKWISLLPGTNPTTPNPVQLVIDPSRALYAAWGLGLASVWDLLNPTSQTAAFRETGWLGEKVAHALPPAPRSGRTVTTSGGVGFEVDGGEGAVGAPVMGSKWQQAGAWAVDGRGRVVWGGRAARVEEVVDLEAGVRALGA